MLFAYSAVFVSGTESVKYLSGYQIIYFDKLWNWTDCLPGNNFKETFVITIYSWLLK